jgi:hypothetical protein
MPITLPNITNCPPGGWEYKLPETERIVNGSNLHELLEKIQSAYAGAGYQAPADLELKVEAYMCGLERMQGYCEDRSDSIFSKMKRSLFQAGNLAHTFHAAVQCMKSLISHVGGTGEKITQEVAESRASVCAVCPKNSDVTGCKNCNKGVIGQLIQRVVGARKTLHDGQLKFCDVCHCYTAAKIWVKHEAIWKHMPEGQKKALPETCWIVKESQNA